MVLMFWIATVLLTWWNDPATRILAIDTDHRRRRRLWTPSEPRDPEQCVVANRQNEPRAKLAAG